MNSDPIEGNTYSEPPAQQPQMVRVRLPEVKPIVTYIILGITLLVYALQWITLSTLGYDLPAVLGIKSNQLIIAGQIWRLITPVFLHSTGSLLHIAFNMYALYALGPGIERLWGHARFLALYFLAGFAGNVLSFAISASNSLGASTAIFGLIAAEGMFLFRNQKVFAGRTRGPLTQIVVVAAINLLAGLAPGIDMWGHLGGLIGGLIFAWFATPLLTVEGFTPDFRLVDQRETREVVMGAILVLGVFALLAGFVITTRMG